MKVFDCFTFFNELDVLELRLHQMAPYVDVFVLVEAPVTHRGEPKPLHYAENQVRFAPFADKIRHVVVDDMPPASDAWIPERFQRDCIRRGLHDANPGDTVLVSDVDEIIRPAAIEQAAARGSFCYLTLELFYFYMNWRATSPGARLWTKAYAIPFAALASHADLSAPRERHPVDYLAHHALDPSRAIIDDAGWHFSWTGGPQRLAAKMNAFAHAEPAMQQWNDTDKLTQAIADRRFFYDGEVLENLTLAVGFPDHLRQHRDRFSALGLVSPDSADGTTTHTTPRLMLEAERTALHEAHFQTRAALDSALVRLSDADAARSEAESAAARERETTRRLGQQLDTIHASSSWRVTAPVRRAVDLARRALRLG